MPVFAASGAFKASYDWPTVVAGDQLDAEYGAPTSGGPPYNVYEITPAKAFALPPTARPPPRPAGASPPTGRRRTMDRDRMLGYLGGRPGAVEDYPFGDDVAVFKVGGRVFAICDLTGQPGSVSLKCDPTLAEALRDRYPAVTPGYHLNKRHWNTIELDGSVPGDELAELVDHSWELVVGKLPRRDRDALGAG
jgi:predicted DNA-binding protein (MmcQ/YjbR family)